MSFIERTYGRHWGITLALLAVLGAASGLAVGARRASACSCVPPDMWSLRLVSIKTGDPNVDHSQLWPAHGRVIEGPKEMTFTKHSSEPGVVRTVTAPR